MTAELDSVIQPQSEFVNCQHCFSTGGPKFKRFDTTESTRKIDGPFITRRLWCLGNWLTDSREERNIILALNPGLEKASLTRLAWDFIN